MVALIRRITEEDRAPDTAGRGVAAYRSKGEGVGVCVLVKEGKMESAYPEVWGGAVWPISVIEVVPWANGIEGQVTGTCLGATVSFFDTRFYANGAGYRVGETYNFRMSAIAYKVGLADDLEAESGTGDSTSKVSFRGARAYMPATLSNESADIDDFWFYSPLEDSSSEVEIAGRTLQSYPITLALPEEFEMRLPLCAAQHTAAPETAGVEPGDDLTGFLWLQGYLEE